MTNVNVSHPAGWQPLHALFKDGLASQLADLRSLQADFTRARNAAAVWIKADTLLQGGDEESMAVVRQSLWTSAVVHYRRGFADGKAHLAKGRPRLKLPDHWTDLLNPEQLEAHEEIWQLANRHVAHRVDERQHMAVSVMLAPPPLPRAIVGRTVLSVDLVEPVPDLVQRLHELCEILIKILSDRSGEVDKAFAEGVRSKDLDSLYDRAHGELATFKVVPKDSPDPFHTAAHPEAG
jgi:hypothetical protein